MKRKAENVTLMINFVCIYLDKILHHFIFNQTFGIRMHFSTIPSYFSRRKLIYIVYKSLFKRSKYDIIMLDNKIQLISKPIYFCSFLDNQNYTTLKLCWQLREVNIDDGVIIVISTLH